MPKLATIGIIAGPSSANLALLLNGNDMAPCSHIGHQIMLSEALGKFRQFVLTF